MTTILKDDILRAAFNAGLAEDENIRWEYSGRYMYGSKCFGIVGNLLDYTGFLLELASEGDDGWDLANDLSQRVNTDNMAMETIYYFPGVKVLDEPEDEDGEDEPLSLQKT